MINIIKVISENSNFVNLFANQTFAMEDIIPRNVLFGEPVKSNPRISPDGKMVLYQILEHDILSLWVKTVGKEDDRIVISFKQQYLSNYFWNSNNSFICLQDIIGSGNLLLSRVKIDTGQVEVLMLLKNGKAGVIKYNHHYPDEMVIALNRDNPNILDLYNMNLKSGTLTLLEKNPGNITEWVVDNNLQLNGIIVTTDDGKDELMLKEEGIWKHFLTWQADDKPLSIPVSFSKDNKCIYLIDYNNCNTAGLIKINIETGERTVLAFHGEYDIYTLIINKNINLFNAYTVLINPDSCEIEAICFNKFRREWIILNETIKEDFEYIRNIDCGDIGIVNRNEADDIWLVCFEKDNGPVSYYAFDRKLKKGIFLFYNQPSLNNYTLCNMEEVNFTSRDGFNIHGYITYPKCEKRTDLPMVLYVHSGPWSRNVWEYSSTVQWIANRGYVCLQINFRGSTGYGKDFMNAGDKEWGGKMHNDLVDGVNWAIKKGIADPARIAICGSGYGGYAAIFAAASTSLFCCSIAIECPGNLVTFIQSMPSGKVYYERLIKRTGDPVLERELLISYSPVYKLEYIKIPVMIAHGLKNSIVKSKESYEIVRTMQNKGLDVEYIVFPDEGHHINKLENRIKLSVIAEKFLARYLGGRYEPMKLYEKDIYIAGNIEKSIDKVLVGRVLREGDKNAFEELVKRYEKQLIVFLFNLTRDPDLSRELLQETFCRVWLYRFSYSFDMPFSSWIFKIAINAVKKYNLKEIKFIKTDLNEINSCLITKGYDKFVDNVLSLQSAVEKIKEPYKTALFLRFTKELDYKEIASIMNISNQQVKNYIHRGKKFILKKMNEL